MVLDSFAGIPRPKISKNVPNRSAHIIKTKENQLEASKASFCKCLPETGQLFKLRQRIVIGRESDRFCEQPVECFRKIALTRS